MDHMSYYKQFVVRLNHYRYDSGKSSVWLDLETIAEFNQRGQSFPMSFQQNEHRQLIAVITHQCSEKLQSNPIFLEDYTHISMVITKINDQYTLHIVMTRRPIAIDSIGVGKDVEISIAVLDRRLSLWGVATHTQTQLYTVYGPDKINRRGLTDFVVIVKPCTLIQVFCIPQQHISYGKATYYHSVPIHSHKVYECPVDCFVHSTLNELAKYGNEKRLSFGSRKLSTGGKIVQPSANTGPLFENSCPNSVNLNATNTQLPIYENTSQHSIFMKSNLGETGEKYDSKGKRRSVKGGIVNALRQKHAIQTSNEFESIFDPDFNKFKSHQKTQNKSFSRVMEDRCREPLKGQLNKEKLDKSDMLMKTKERIFEIQNMITKQPFPKESADGNILSRPRQLEIKLIDTLERCMADRNNSKSYLNERWTESQPTITLITGGIKYEVNRSIISQHSKLIGEALRAHHSPLNQICLDDFSQLSFSVFLESLKQSSSLTHAFRQVSVDVALEIIRIMRYLQVPGTPESECLMLEQQLLARCLLPNLNPKVFLEILLWIECNKHKGPIWKLAFELITVYFKSYSKEILHDEEEHLYERFAELQQQTALDLVSDALREVQEVNHMMDLLGLLIYCRFGSNAIEVLQTIASPYQPHMQFLKRDYQLPQKASRNPFIIEDFRQLSEPIEAYTKSLITSKNCSLDSRHVYTFSTRRLTTKSKKWLIMCEQFTCANHKWRLIIEYNEGNLSLFIQNIGLSGRIKFRNNFASCFMKFSCSIDSVEIEKSLFYSFATGQQEIAGLCLLQDYGLEDFSIEVRVSMKELIVHSCCLHHLSLRWRDLIKYSSIENENLEDANRRLSVDMSRRRSCVLLQHKLFDEAQELSAMKMLGSLHAGNLQYDPSCLKSWIYKLSEHHLYYLFNSDNLEVNNQSLLLLYLSMYYLEDNRGRGLPLTALRFHLIPLKNLLSVSLHHPMFRQNDLFLGLLQSEIESRMYGRQKQIIPTRRNRKISTILKEHEAVEELMEWLKSDHFKVFKKQINGNPMDHNRTLKNNHLLPGLSQAQQLHNTYPNIFAPPKQPITNNNSSNDCTLF